MLPHSEMLTKLALAAVICLFAVFLAASLRRRDAANPGLPESEPLFVFVKLPESIEPLERGRKYEDPLSAALERDNVGEITGGGSQLGELQPDGTRTIEWVGIDVELTDATRGLATLRAELKRLGAPPGTVMEYTRNAVGVEEPLL